MIMKKHYKISLYKALDNDLYSIYSLMKQVYDDLEDKSLFVCDDIDFVKQQLTKTGFGVITKANDNIIGCLIVRFPGLEKDNLGYLRYHTSYFYCDNIFCFHKRLSGFKKR